MDIVQVVKVEIILAASSASQSIKTVIRLILRNLFARNVCQD
jgi:hypothetical protein